MFFIDRVLLIGPLLVLVGIASSRFSAKVGLPVLVLFVAVGMAAGSEGLGGIAFENYGLAHALGTAALAVILFDGGLRTSEAAVRRALAPALTLATVGVLVTSVLTGGAAMLLLNLEPLQAILLGAIVGSTDAAAVFSVMRSSGVNVEERVEATLEVESGMNDPMAVFLVLALVLTATGELSFGEGAFLLVRQVLVGGVVGWVVGRLASAALARLRLSAAGLYPVFTASAGLLAYGAAATAGGSGFLSVYVAGITLAARPLVFRRGILLFHDGAAWLAQICLFVLLGLLSFPSRLVDVAGPGLLLAGTLILVARPVAVAVSLAPFGFSWREHLFVSWAGLRGAVPIVLAIYPLLFGLPGAALLFDLAFFVVLVSAVTQGWSLPIVARLLGLQRPRPPSAQVELEISSLQDVNGDIVEYGVPEGSRAAGRMLRDLPLPDQAVVAMVARGATVIPPRGSTVLLPGDHVFVVVTGAREAVDALFRPGSADAPPPSALTASPASFAGGRVSFPLPGDTPLEALEEFYGIVVEGAPGDRTVAEELRRRLGDRLAVGRGMVVGTAKIHVRRLADDGEVDQAELYVPPPGD